MYYYKYMIKIKDRYFKLEINRKDIKNIYLRIKNECLEITCPLWLQEKDIISFINSKKDWILNKTNKKENSKLIVNDTIYYLGQKYYLNIAKGNYHFILRENRIFIFTPNSDKNEALRFFYKEGQKNLFLLIQEKEMKYLKIIEDYGYHLKPEYKFRQLKSAWGINYPKKNLITINDKLIHFSKRHVEAIVWHELLHFIIPNHSQRFYKILKLHMPDYDLLIKEIY